MESFAMLFADNDFQLDKIIIILAILIISCIISLIKLFISKIRMKKFTCTEGKITYVEKFSYRSGGKRYIDPPSYIQTDNGFRVKYALRVGYEYYDNDYQKHNGEFQVENGFAGMNEGSSLKIYFDPKKPSKSFAEKDIKEQEKLSVGIYVAFAVLALIAVPIILLYLS